MKKFIIKIIPFIIPFLSLYILNISFYNKSEGGLTRLGFLYDNPAPKSSLDEQFSMKVQYTKVSELNLNTKSKFDLLIIGDSFSDQDSLCYKNFLAKDGFSVLYLDRFLSNNPVKSLTELIDSGFFDLVKTDYIILQSVERSFVQRCQDIDFSKTMSLDSLKTKIDNYVEHVPKRNVEFFSDATIKIPLTNIQYHFNDKPKSSRTYKAKTTKDNLFSGDPDNVLFYEEDIKMMTFKHDSLKIVNSVKSLNQINDLLSKIDIKLIVLVSPDKYDLYYTYIKDKSSYKEPMFFKYYDQLPKDYTSINSFDILSNSIEHNKDVYYYDDTHWSPIGAKIIAKEIKKTINEIKEGTQNNLYN